VGSAGPPAGTRERRRLRRAFTRIPVLFQAGTLRGTGHIKNLTQEGMFIRTHILPAAGDNVHLTFTTPDGHKIEVEGVVRWTTDQMDETCPLGFGVRLVRVDEEYLRFFEKILRA
jgi:uncharacterized protein (TIGR02266 family)